VSKDPTARNHSNADDPFAELRAAMGDQQPAAIQLLEAIGDLQWLSGSDGSLSDSALSTIADATYLLLDLPEMRELQVLRLRELVVKDPGNTAYYEREIAAWERS